MSEIEQEREEWKKRFYANPDYHYETPSFGFLVGIVPSRFPSRKRRRKADRAKVKRAAKQFVSHILDRGLTHIPRYLMDGNEIHPA